MAESIVMVEAPHNDFITDQRLERHIRVRSFTCDEVCAATHGFEVDRFRGQGLRRKLKKKQRQMCNI